MTLKEALAQGYKFTDSTWERGYVSRKQDNMTATVRTAGGRRKDQLYVLLPSHLSTRYCIRQYLMK